MKKQIISYVIVVAAFMAAPTFVHAEDSPAKTPATEAGTPTKKHVAPFHGKVSAVDATAMTVKLNSQTFNITSETKILKEGKPATFADITVGEKVTGQYKKDANGKLAATVIHIGGKGDSTEGAKKTDKTEKN